MVSMVAMTTTEFTYSAEKGHGQERLEKSSLTSHEAFVTMTSLRSMAFQY
jgi:hypothetical protein